MPTLPNFELDGQTWNLRARNRVVLSHGMYRWENFPSELRHLLALLPKLDDEAKAAIRAHLPPDEEAFAQIRDLTNELANTERCETLALARLAQALELLDEYEAQWGTDYLAKKWELKERRAALTAAAPPPDPEKDEP